MKDEGLICSSNGDDDDNDDKGNRNSEREGKREAERDSGRQGELREKELRVQVEYEIFIRI